MDFSKFLFFGLMLFIDSVTILFYLSDFDDCFLRMGGDFKLLTDPDLLTDRFDISVNGVKYYSV
jgi:hypothetical protein